MMTRKSKPEKLPQACVLFCYGSNLDPYQLHARCPRAVPIGRARLPHHRLAFGGYSIGWRGAVANVLPDPGGFVEGYLNFLTREDVRSMDQREGVPFAYERLKRPVVDEFGGKHLASLYVLAGDDFEADAPSARYFDVLWYAYGIHGFDKARLALAEGVAKPGLERHAVRRRVDVRVADDERPRTRESNKRSRSVVSATSR